MFICTGISYRAEKGFFIAEMIQKVCDKGFDLRCHLIGGSFSDDRYQQIICVFE
ncbi:hypothetical protein MTBSS4_670013 [Magnetospirillum sp. SS-4]|nr:hypothetical protein MTBSS4_670013 [Magnetospirillum sp. SS-4]